MKMLLAALALYALGAFAQPRAARAALPSLYAHVGGHVLEIALEDNSSASALAELLRKGPVTVAMHDYGGFEKVGDLGSRLPTNDRHFTTGPGDVILYQGRNIVIYYGTNSWSFTRLGKVRNASRDELRRFLGAGDVSVTFSLEP